MHNEQVCLYLQSSGLYSDWVITTAFYSALHFVKYKAFPLNEDGDHFDDFDTYFKTKEFAYGRKRSKHQVVIDVCQKHVKKIAPAYRELFDLCNTARYFDYQVSEDDVNLAISNLGEIKKYCNTEKPTVKAKYAFKKK